MLTYGKVKEIVAKYAQDGGQCPSSSVLDLFIRQLFQDLLYRGTHGNLAKFCFSAANGCFTVPNEIEVIEKAKIEGSASNVWSMWKEFSSNPVLYECVDSNQLLYQEPGYFPTEFDLPAEGGAVQIIGTADEKPDAHVIIQGLDLTGREVFVNHKEVQIKGEYLSIIKNTPRRTHVKFSKITSITRTPTVGYTPLYAINDKGEETYLSDYSPVETLPAYVRYRLKARCPALARISVIARIRVKDQYSDNDKVPFDNISAIEFSAMNIRAARGGDIQTVAAMDQFIERSVGREADFKKVNNGKPIEVLKLTSAGSIRGLVRAGRFRQRRFR